MAFPADYTVLAKLSTVTAEIGTGTHPDLVALVTEASLGTQKSNIFANTDNGGGDARFSLDEAGTSQIPLHLISWDTSGETCVCRIPRSVNSTTSVDVYVWGDNTGDSQPAASSTYGSESVYTGWRAQYPLNETANNSAGGYADVTGNGYDGTGTSMSEANRTLPNGTSGSGFDGSNDYIGLPTSIFPTTAQSTYTCSYWAEPDSLSADSRVFALIDTVGSEDSLVSWMDANGSGDGWAGQLRVDGVNYIVGVDDSSAQAARWDRVVVVKTASLFAIYVNGALTDSVVVTDTAIGHTIDSADIGRFSSGTPTYMNGGIADLGLLLSEWSADYITTEYNNQNAPADFWVASAVSGGLVINDLAQGQTLDEITLTQANILSVDGLSNAQTISEPILNQNNILSTDDILTAHTISEPALTQAHVLSVDNISTGHTLSEVTLAVAGALLVDDLSNAQTVSNISLIQHNLLVVDPITTGQTISNITLTPEGALAVNSLVTSQSLSEPSLTAHLSLIVDDITNNQFISVVSFDDGQDIGTVTAAFKANDIGVEYGLLEFTVRFKE